MDLELGSIPLTVRSMDKRTLTGLPARFTALVPCLDLARLPTTLQVLIELLRRGCTDLILAGPRAEAFEGQVGLAVEQQGVSMQITAYDNLSDACNAVLLGALIHRGGVALVADEPELLERLHGVANANGWMKSEGAAPEPAPKRKPAAKKQPAPKKKPAAKKKAAPKKKKPKKKKTKK
jgi:hypothetical protein